MRFCCYHSPDNYRLCRTIEIKSPVPDRKGTWNQIHSTPITLHSNVTGQLGNWSLGSVSQRPCLNSRLKCTLSWHFIRTYSGTRQAIELLIRWLWMFPCRTWEGRWESGHSRFGSGEEERGGERRREVERVYYCTYGVKTEVTWPHCLRFIGRRLEWCGTCFAGVFTLAGGPFATGACSLCVKRAADWYMLGWVTGCSSDSYQILDEVFGKVMNWYYGNIT